MTASLLSMSSIQQELPRIYLYTPDISPYLYLISFQFLRLLLSQDSFVCRDRQRSEARKRVREREESAAGYEVESEEERRGI